MEELEERVAALETWATNQATVQDDALNYSTDLNMVWLVWCGILVFFMQVGFAMLEVGSISPKNTKAVLIKNMSDASIGAICWWTLGHGFAYGKDAGGFIGTSDFVFSGSAPDSAKGVTSRAAAFAHWFFQWTFAATAATVVSGAVAERVKIVAYVQLSLFISVFVYPVVVHWAWSIDGWASPFRCADQDTAAGYAACRLEERPLLLGCGTADFSGAGVVHVTGGISALVAAAVIRPRAGRFRGDGSVYRLPQQSPALQTLGALILWVGWYGFCGGSVASISDGRSILAAKAVVNTTVAAGSSVLSMSILVKTFHKKFDSAHLNNGILSGLVAISASGPLVDAEGAFIIGSLASAFYLLGVRVLKRLKVDDVVQASAVHFGCGSWGLMASGLLATSPNYDALYSYGVFAEPGRGDRCCGLFYGGNGELLAANITLLLAIVAWVAGLVYVAMLLIKGAVGLRVPLHVEELGMDKSRHFRKRGSSALRRALGSAAATTTAGRWDNTNETHSRRSSAKASGTASPHGAPPRNLVHWKELAQAR